MATLTETAPSFVEMAHRIVWATVATVAPDGRPWTRVLHPIWEWDGANLVGWIATAPTPVKERHLAHQPAVSGTYWHPNQDTCTFNGTAAWRDDLATRRRIWDLFLHGPEPVGYDPSIIPGWDDAESEMFVPLRVSPTWLKVMPGTVLTEGRGQALTWRG